MTFVIRTHRSIANKPGQDTVTIVNKSRALPLGIKKTKRQGAAPGNVSGLAGLRPFAGHGPY